jgi:hypothetical protein
VLIIVKPEQKAKKGRRKKGKGKRRGERKRERRKARSQAKPGYSVFLFEKYHTGTLPV